MASSSERRKPRIGIVFSHQSPVTTTSKDVAVYLGASLQLGGFSEVYLIPFRPSGSPKVPPPPKDELFRIVPFGGRRARTADPRECSYQEWSILEQCNLVLLCVGPDHTKAAAMELAKIMKTGSDSAAISLQQGIRNSNDFKAAFNGKKFLVVDGAVGISVARDPADGSYHCLNRGSLVLERLKKADEGRGVKFLSLLSTAEVPMLYRPTITPFTWGALLYSTSDAIVALTGSTCRQFLRTRKTRLLWAAMMREGVSALAKNAAGVRERMSSSSAQKWSPENPCGYLGFSNLETFICLPTPIFLAAAWLLLPVPAKGLAAAMQGDVREGRQTAAEWTLGELLKAGETSGTPMPACKAVNEALLSAIEKKDGVPSLRVEELLEKGKSSVQECTTATWRAVGRKAAITLAICSVLWLFWASE